jgi:hypothetical protein
MPTRLLIKNRSERTLLQADREEIERAFLEALHMARQVSADMRTVWNQPGTPRQRRTRRSQAWREHPHFVTWFGSDTDTRLLRRLRRRILRLEKWLDGGRVAVLVRDGSDLFCRGGSNAYTILPRQPIRVHLCPPWFEKSLPRKAAIIIHELTHQLGFGHPDGTTNEQEARDLARRNSRKARRSPENFERLYENYASPLA